MPDHQIVPAQQRDSYLQTSTVDVRISMNASMSTHFHRIDNAEVFDIRSPRDIRFRVSALEIGCTSTNKVTQRTFDLRPMYKLLAFSMDMSEGGCTTFRRWRVRHLIFLPARMLTFGRIVIGAFRKTCPIAESAPHGPLRMFPHSFYSTPIRRPGFLIGTYRRIHAAPSYTIDWPTACGSCPSESCDSILL